MNIHSIILRLCLLLCLCFATITQAQQHICPTPANLKYRLSNKNLMNYDYHNWSPIGGINYYYGSIDVTDSFYTKENWVFHFIVRHVNSFDEAWNLFQNHLDSLSLTNESREAVTDGSFWSCRYGISSENFDDNKGHTFSVYIRLKSQ